MNFPRNHQNIQHNHFLHTISSLFIYKMPFIQGIPYANGYYCMERQKVQSKLKAAQIYGVSESSLRKRLNGIKPRTETRANGHKLTEYEEEVLVKRLLYADKRGFSIRSEFLRGMTQILLHERTHRSNCSSWNQLGLFPYQTSS